MIPSLVRAVTVMALCMRGLIAQDPLPVEVELAEDPPPQHAHAPEAGGNLLRLIDISVATQFSVGGSTEPDESLRTLQAGGHDPRQRGFNLQAVELSLIGPVSPQFRAETHAVFFLDEEGETGFELEEAFVESQRLSYGFELQAGLFFTEFGRINTQHVHQWTWLDQPVIHSRFFGADGMRGAGARMSWLAPLAWTSEFHVGVQNAGGETMVSFRSSEEAVEERPIGGRPFVETDVHGMGDLVYLLRWRNEVSVGAGSSADLGFSALFGPNSSGEAGKTRVYGVDLALDWQLGESSGVIRWESEFLFRDYRADASIDVGDPNVQGDEALIPAGDLGDYGFYSQLGYGVTEAWRLGMRYEFASGDGDTWDAASQSLVERSSDAFRDDRHRLSPLITWQASEQMRLRLQYNYDRADHLAAGDAHTVWLGCEVLIGSNPSHKH